MWRESAQAEVFGHISFVPQHAAATFNGNGELAVMPNPKRRHSKSRRGKRRAHDFLQTVTPGVCPNCLEPKPPHQACPKCGYYKGRQVMEGEEEI